MASLFRRTQARSCRRSAANQRFRQCILESLEGRQLLAADVTLFADSFETGSNSNDWVGNWVEDSQNDYFRSSQRATDGNLSAEVDGRASNATLRLGNPIDLSSYDSATLTFDWLIESGFDSGEYIALDVSSDGGTTWNNSVRQLNGNSDPENQWQSESVDLTPYTSSNVLVRFRAQVSRSDEDANIDNVKITGVNSAPEISINDVSVIEGESGYVLADSFVSTGSGGLLSPRGVAFGPDGNLYVASTDTDSVLRYDGVTGDFLDEFVTSGSGGLDFPREIVFHNGDLYVVSSATNAVLRYDGASGAFVSEFVSAGDGGLEEPRGLLFGDNNDFYVTSAGNMDAVLRYNATTGAFIDEFIPTGVGGLANPTRIVFGPDGNFYVSSTAAVSNSVLRFDSSGNLIDTFIAPGAGGLDGPTAMAFRSGTLYVAGARSNSVVAFDAMDGTPRETTVPDSDLRNPNSIIFDDAGRLYVSSRATNQVLRYTDAASALLSVRLSSPSDDVVTVDFSTVEASALAGSDFVATAGTVTFAAGQTERVVAVPILAEAAAEPAEAFDVLLSNPTNAGLSDTNGRVTILERRVSVSNASETEGDSTPHYRGPFVDGLPAGHFNPLTFGPDGHVYTAVGTGSGYNTVQRFDGTTGQFIDTFIDNSDPDHKINGVRDIVFHPTDGMVYVASSYTDEVLRYDAVTGQFVDVFVEANSGGIDHPDGMMFGPDFNNDGKPELYVTGWLSGSVVRYDGATGAPLGTYVGAGSGGLSFPFSLAFRQDELFVTSAGTNQILKFNAQSGSFLGVAATTGLDYPRGLTFGPDDLLYVTSGDNDRIIRFTPSGQYVDDYVPAGTAGMDDPRTPRFGPDGDLYVTVTGKNEIMRFGDQNEAIFTLNLSLPSNDPVVVDFSTAPIGASPATEGADYVGTTGHIVFEPGVTQRFITVAINDDSQQESDETFELAVSLPQPVAGLGMGDGQAIGTILDDGDTSNQPPVVDAGADQTLSDNDGTGIESVTLVGLASDSEGTIDSVEWTLGGVAIGNSQNLTTDLPVGVHTLTFTATDDGGLSSSDTVEVTVVANQGPTADAGADQSIADSDGDGFETVTLVGIGSDNDGYIVGYEWSDGANVIGTTASISPVLAVGTHVLTLAVTDNGGATASDSVTVIVEAASTGPNLSHGNIASVSSTWQTVSLGQSYNSAVIVATPRYNSGSGPGVVRINNVTATSFDVRVDNAGLSAFSGGVHFIAIEEGVYDVPGEYKLEAVKVDSSVTSGKSGGWQIGSQGYQQSYSNPVVVGQVMSANDADWSVFWSSSNSRTSPANSGSLNIGKHVAEDTDTTRATETLGYFVIESTSSGTIDGLDFTAGVGNDTILGVGNGTYQYSDVGPSGASTAVLSMAGMDGGDGGWAALIGSNPLSSTGSIALSIDEDQLRDSERNHTTEQVAYFVIGEAVGEGEAARSLATPQITVPNPLDVNGDGTTTPLDALQVINYLNASLQTDGMTLEEGDMALDANGDNQISAIDALLVINRLNANAETSAFASDSSNARAIDSYFGDLEDDEEESIFGLRLA